MLLLVLQHEKDMYAQESVYVLTMRVHVDFIGMLSKDWMCACVWCCHIECRRNDSFQVDQLE